MHEQKAPVRWHDPRGILIFGFDRSRRRDLLTNALQGFQAAGFAALADVQISSPPPSTPPAKPTEQPADKSKEMFKAYISAISTRTFASYGLEGRLARALGLNPVPGKSEWLANGNMPAKVFSLLKTATKEEWGIEVIEVKGVTQAVLVFLDKDGLMTGYLISAEGELLKAAEVGTTSREIPLTEARKGFETQIAFWLKYYAKHPTP